MELYALNIRENKKEQNFNYLINQISNVKKERLSKLYSIDDFLRSLFSELLLRFIIGKKLGLSNNEIIFDIGDHGKPYLKCFNYFHFNLSHSGDWVICAIDNRFIGVDIEKIRPIDFKLVERFFSKEEIKYFNKFSMDEKNKVFYGMWTLKESYLKLIGKGLLIPLDSFIINFESDPPKLIQSQNTIDCFFKQISFDSNYKLSICTSQPPTINSVIHITTKEILNWFAEN